MSSARRGGPRTLSRTTDANLDCAFFEIGLLSVVLNIGRAPRNDPPVRNPVRFQIVDGPD